MSSFRPPSRNLENVAEGFSLPKGATQMKRIGIIFLVVTMVTGSTAWVYATGNIPGVNMPENGISIWVFSHFPSQAKRTTAWCGKFWAGCRRAGISVPFSYNEKIFEILKIRLETDAICRDILRSIYYPWEVRN